MSIDRLAAATRLEITEPVETDTGVTGRYSGVETRLEGDGDSRNLTLTLAEEALWDHIGLFNGSEVNDPDVVVTRDLAFDSAISVLALDGQGPNVAAILSNDALREQLRAFFVNWPNAVLKGRELRLPAVPNDPKWLGSAMKEAAALMNALRGTMLHTPTAPLEAPPVLPTGDVKSAPEKVSGIDREFNEMLAARSLRSADEPPANARRDPIDPLPKIDIPRLPDEPGADRTPDAETRWTLIYAATTLSATVAAFAASAIFHDPRVVFVSLPFIFWGGAMLLKKLR